MMPANEFKKAFEESAEFAHFCQEFKKAWWEEKDKGYNIPEEQLDRLAMIAFELI